MHKQRTSDDVSFGQLVGSYRTLRTRLSQKALARLLGMSEAAFRNWETDQSRPEAKNLQKLLEVFLDLGIFTAGKEVKEARELWQASGVNVVFDEVWLNALANTRKPKSETNLDTSQFATPSSSSENDPAPNSGVTSPHKEENPSPSDVENRDLIGLEGGSLNKGRHNGTTTLAGIPLWLPRMGNQDFIAGNDQLDYAESIINLAWEAWFASRPQQARHEVTKLLPNLEQFLFMPVATIHLLRAKELIVRGHGLLGSVYLDARQNDAALYHYTQAYRFAEEINDRDFTPTYLCLRGEVLRRQKDPSGSLLHMENARDKAAHASNATRGHILQLLAYTYGDTGQEAAFESTISEAADLLAFSGEGRDTVQKEFVPFEIYEIRGKINRDLGRPSEALLYLELAERSLTRTNEMTPRWFALLEISRSQVCCDAGDMTTGLDLACKGFIKAYQCHSQMQMNRVRKLFRQLSKSPLRNHPKMSDLENLLSDETYMSRDND